MDNGGKTMMWTKAIFEQAMTAPWTVHGEHPEHVTSGGRIILSALDSDKRHARATAAIAVLGRRALDLVLKADAQMKESDRTFPCESFGDEWRAIVDEVERITSGTAI